MNQLVGCLAIVFIALVVGIFVSGILFVKFGLITFVWVFAAIGILSLLRIFL